MKIKNSFNLVKASFKFILKDPELVTYSILSSISLLFILGGLSLIGAIFYPGIEKFLLNNGVPEQYFSLIFILVGIIYYFILSFITFYFNTAIISSVQNRINGSDNQFMDGIKFANNSIKSITKWSLVNTFVNVILMIIENLFSKDSIIGKIIIGLIGTSWNIATYFSFPLMILEKKGVGESIKESSLLFKKTWGERAMIYVGVGLFFGIIFILNFIIIGLLFFIGQYIIGLIYSILSVLIIILLSNTCGIVLKAIVYNYTKNGTIPDIIKEDNLIENMIKI